MTYPTTLHGAPLAPRVASMLFYIDGRRQTGTVSDALDTAQRIWSAYRAWLIAADDSWPAWVIPYEDVLLDTAEDLADHIEAERDRLMGLHPRHVVPDSHDGPGWIEGPLETLIEASERRIAAAFLLDAAPIVALLPADQVVEVAA